MAAHNRPSGARVSDNYVDSIFARKFEDLEQRYLAVRDSPGDGIYEVLNIVSLLRSLVYDSPLYLVVNRKFNLNLQVPEWVMPQWEGIKPELEIDPMYEQHCSPLTDSFWQGGRWYPFSIPDYLGRSQPGFVVGCQQIAPGEAIRYYANALGAVHLDGKIKEKDLKAASMDNTLQIGSYPAIAHLLATRVAPAILRALKPLYDAVVERRREQS